MNRIAFGLIKGSRLLHLNILGYAIILAASLSGVSGSLVDDAARAKFFSRESEFPAVLAQILAVAFLFAVYFAAIANWRRLSVSKRYLAPALAAAVLLAALSVPGMTSADPFFYIRSARLLTHYHLNPYLHTYREVHDAYSALALYPGPLPYGPVTLLALVPAGFASSAGLWAAVYVLKAEWVAVFCANAWLVWNLARRMGADPDYSFFVFAFNPLVLLELIVAGHNDGIMIFFSLLALLYCRRGRFDVALVLALLSGFAKISGLIVFVTLFVLAVRQRSWKQLAIAVAVSAGIVTMLVMTILPNANSWRALLNPGGVVNANSLYGWLSDMIGIPPDSPGFRYARLFAAAALGVICAWRLSRIGDFASLVRECGYLTLALLVIYAGQFWVWYATWLVPYAALTESKTLRESILLYSFTALSLYAIPMVWSAHDLTLRFTRWALANTPPLVRLSVHKA